MIWFQKRFMKVTKNQLLFPKISQENRKNSKQNTTMPSNERYLYVMWYQLGSETSVSAWLHRPTYTDRPD